MEPVKTKREVGAFIVQQRKVIADSQEVYWVDLTSPSNEGEQFSSAAQCEAWIRKYMISDASSDIAPTVRIIQARKEMTLLVEVSKRVVIAPTVTPSESSNG